MKSAKTKHMKRQVLISLIIIAALNADGAVVSTLSSANPSIVAANISTGTPKQAIYKFALTVSGGSASFTGFNFTTNAGYAAADVAKFQLWYGSDLGTAVQTGTDITTSLGPGLHTFAAFTLSLPSPCCFPPTYYFWVTADITAAATLTNKITVPAITTANLTVTGKTGSAYAGGTQTIIKLCNSAIPTITNVSPLTGNIASTVTITGTNFNTTPANNIVFFGSAQASVTAATATSLTVTVPFGASYDNVSVTNLASNLTAYKAPFDILYSCLSSNFAAAVDFAVAGSPYVPDPMSISASDLDGDGKPDLIITMIYGPEFSVFRNTSTPGSISFAARVDSAGSNSDGLVIGDVDGDGKPDLVVTDMGLNVIHVYRNTCTPGIISFAAKIDYPTGTANAGTYGITMGDLDSDGKPDLVATNYSEQTISVFRNTSTAGTISFATKVDYALGYMSERASINDLDGDGKPDLVIACLSSNVVSIYRNITSSCGTIALAAKVDYTTGNSPYDINIVDFDGDGKLDLSTSNGTDNSISLRLNTSTPGTISFGATVAYVVPGGSPGYSLMFSGMGDFNGDGKADLAVGNNITETVSVFQNTSSPGTVSFATHVDYSTGAISGPTDVAAVDLDGDTNMDMAVTCQGWPGKISVFRNTCTPLPIELLSFTASPGEYNTVQCLWNTASESNNEYFLVERSKDGKTFEAIGKVKAAGNTSTGNQYSFTDGSPLSVPKGEAIYYRLRQVDFNGEFTYSNIVAVVLELSRFAVRISPNPSGGEDVNCGFFMNGNSASVMVSDVLGNKVVTENVKGPRGFSNLKLHTANLPSGIYFIEINDEFRQEQVKFIKE